MKKLSALALFVILCSSAGYSQKSSAEKFIERANQKFIKWFNSGKADSIVTQYHPKGCLATGGCGTAVIRNHYRSEVGKYTFRELTTLKVEVKDTVATETGNWRLTLATGNDLSGKYRTEWRKVNAGWVIFREEILE